MHRDVDSTIDGTQVARITLRSFHLFAHVLDLRSMCVLRAANKMLRHEGGMHKDWVVQTCADCAVESLQVVDIVSVWHLYFLNAFCVPMRSDAVHIDSGGCVPRLCRMIVVYQRSPPFPGH